MMCGGTSEEKEITDEIKAICDEIKGEVESKANENYQMFQPLKYTSQVVAGTNYFIKIQVGSDGNCIHVRVYQPLPYTNQGPQVHGVLKDKTADEPIIYFDQNQS